MSEQESSAELEQVRLENETLSGVVGVVASGPDLGHILDRVVDLLTRATDCHACFVYLLAADQLDLRAASPVYSHLVGNISFGAEEGLSGWAMRHRKPAFIREGAIADPRTTYIKELEEERFQSMVAVPIPSRSGESIGAIVLHTVAPREFDEGIINVLSRAASLVAGAIENARLYELAGERVESLMRLSRLGRDIAAVSDRDSLYLVATEGVRELLGTEVCRIYELELDGHPHRVATSPYESAGVGVKEEAEAVSDLLESGPTGSDALVGRLGLEQSPRAAAAVSLSVGAQQFGILLTAADREWTGDDSELLQTAAQQIALALEKIELIERLTEENFAHDLFEALTAGELELATARARAGGVDLGRPHVALEVRALSGTESALLSERGEQAEQTIRRGTPGTICDLRSNSLRALIPTNAEGHEAARKATERLNDAAATQSLVIGASQACSGVAALTSGLRESADAATVASVLLDRGGVLHYRDTGVYRYLTNHLEDGGPDDNLRRSAERLAAYDQKRRSELLATLNEYLEQGRSMADTARILTIHVNTLRQRLQRIEVLTGLSLADEDLLALHLAVKLAVVRAA